MIERSQGFTQVAMQRDLRAHDLIELGFVDIGVNDRVRVRCELGGIAGHPVVKTHA